GFQPALHDVGPSVELAHFLALRDDGTHASGREERGNTGAACSNALGKSSLRDQLQVKTFLKNHLLEKPIFADVAADMALDLTSIKEQSHAQAVHADVVADGVEILYAFAYERADQV